jgi:hypothetical protein
MKAQEYKESRIVNKRIDKKKLRRKFESNEIECPTVYFCEFFEKFNCLENSILGYIEVILFTELIFPRVSILWQFFESLNLIPHCNIDLRSALKKEMMMRNIESTYLLNTNDETDCHSFFWNFFEDKKEKKYCESLWREGEIFVHQFLRWKWKEFLTANEHSESQIFLDSESENIVSEKDEIRQLLKLSGGSRIEGCSSFSEQKSTTVIRIDDSVEIVDEEDFKGYESLETVIFSSSNHLRVIAGFQECTSLCRIEIPSSVETIGSNGFIRCTSLNEIIFSSDSHLRIINGFQECTSLCRIEIPSSVENLAFYGFIRCTSLNEIIFSSGSHLRIIDGFQECTSLCRLEIPSSVEKIGYDGF